MPAPILTFENLGLVQGSGWLFKGLNIYVQERDRLALIGRNGAGKSTLLRLLAATVDADEGRRTIVPGTRVVLLEQEPDFRGHATLRDWVLHGASPPEPHEAEAIADQLGIDLSREAASASGGERRRAGIVRALALDPDVLLLDEPTNHLDLAAITWLESWLGRFKGAFIAISHDRTFLTRLTKQTLWIDRGTLRRTEIGFGGFEAWQEKAFAEEARAADKLDAKLKIEHHWLERGVTARRKRNMGRLGKLHEMRAERARMIGPTGTAKIALSGDDARSKSVIEADAISKSFGERTIIRNFSLRIQRGDRIGLVGANGAGKSTLLKLLTGEIAPDSGTVTRAKTLNAIIIDQQRALLSPEKTVRDVLCDGGDWVTVRGEKKHVHGYLKDFLFPPGLADARIGTLSGGEQSRLLLAREFARPGNLLVLDEPTNDLDLETLDLLQEVIADYEGTVLLVSHDRDFLDRTVAITLGLDGSGKVDIVAGGYAEWEKQRNNVPLPPAGGSAAWGVAGGKPPGKLGGKSPPESAHPERSRGTSSNEAENRATHQSKEESLDAARHSPSTALGKDGEGAPKRRVKLSYKDQRDYETLPARVETLTATIKAAEAELGDATLYTRDPARFAALTAAIEAARAERDAAEERWLGLAEMVG